jgi:hypothetical protein
LAYSIHNSGGEDAAHLEPIAWSGEVEAGDTANFCRWVGDVVLLGDVTVGDGVIGPMQEFTLKISDDDGDGFVEIGELPNRDREAAGEDEESTEFRISEWLVLDTQQGSAVDDLRFKRASNLQYTFPNLPVAEAGEWTGVVVDSYLLDDLHDLYIQWAEKGLLFEGDGIDDDDDFHDIVIEDSNTGVSCENGADPKFYACEIHALIEGLSTSGDSFPILPQPSTRFCMDLTQGLVPPHYYIANRNTSPQPIDATECVWRDYADQNDVTSESWMFYGPVTYQSKANTADEGLVKRSRRGGAVSSIRLFTSPEPFVGGSGSFIGPTPANAGQGVGVTGTGDLSVTVSPNALTIVPNPATDSITIGFECDGGSAKVAVFDISGRRVDTVYVSTAVVGHHEQVYDTSSLPTGVYLVRLTTERATTTQRLVINR